MLTRSSAGTIAPSVAQTTRSSASVEDETSMPYYPHLIEWLSAAPHRVNAAGEMQLSAAEAAVLRACEFPTAAPGLWKIPPLPRDLVRAYLLPPQLAEGHT